MPAAKKKQPKLHSILVDKLPTQAAVAADLLYNTRQERLALQKIPDALDDQEKALKNWFIETLPKSDATGIAGKVARVSVSADTFVPSVTEWPKVFAWILKNKRYDFLMRQLNAKAVQEFWDSGKEIPGVEKFRVVKVSCVKV